MKKIVTLFLLSVLLNTSYANSVAVPILPGSGEAGGSAEEPVAEAPVCRPAPYYFSEEVLALTLISTAYLDNTTRVGNLLVQWDVHDIHIKPHFHVYELGAGGKKTLLLKMDVDGSIWKGANLSRNQWRQLLSNSKFLTALEKFITECNAIGKPAIGFVKILCPILGSIKRGIPPSLISTMGKSLGVVGAFIGSAGFAVACEILIDPPAANKGADFVNCGAVINMAYERLMDSVFAKQLNKIWQCMIYRSRDQSEIATLVEMQSQLKLTFDYKRFMQYLRGQLGRDCIGWKDKNGKSLEEILQDIQTMAEGTQNTSSKLTEKELQSRCNSDGTLSDESDEELEPRE